MPRKRRASSTSLDIEEDEFAPEEKYSRDDLESRAPRNAANARERARMRVLSKAFCRLKTTLPWVPADTKLSKLDTLRLAATYIAHLRAVLRDDGDAHRETTRSLSLALSWPFAIQSAGSPMLLNNNCNSSASSTSSGSGQYRGQQGPQEIQNLHHTSHQNLPIRNNHETQLSYY
ncbi:transcription factor 21 [Orussus abietinus]|uniref:transcription factor 21 n=1 Tax=Orussus abietinus TaxID=222816 RepID=UPI000626506D|nr:transcription factor 21 [Orussus abietinus]